MFLPHVKAFIQLKDQKLITSMERPYQADLLRSFPEGDGNITAFCRKINVFGTIYRVSQAWSSINSITVIQLRRKTAARYR
jgi:hypothetical protein